MSIFVSTFSQRACLPSHARYDLQFSVSDRAWRQRGVAANVTVTVQTLLSEALTHAVPLALSPITPEDLTRGWFPSVMRIPKHQINT